MYCVADRIITDEDLVALCCTGAEAGSKLAASSKYGPQFKVDATTFTHGTSPPSNMANIHPVAVNAL